MPSYEINQSLSGIDELEAAFRRITGDRYRYVVSRSRSGSGGARYHRYGMLLVRQNACHGMEIHFEERQGRQFLITALASPKALLGSVLGRLIARTIFGTRKQLVTDVNEVIVNSFPVTVLDSDIQRSGS